MRIIVQRVKEAKVIIENETFGEINHGYLLYVCIESQDTNETLKYAAERIKKLRINEDENQKMNLNIAQTGGSILSISQFTLSWNGKKGHRPSFDGSMSGVEAKQLFEGFNNQLRLQGLKVATGVFGADMLVQSINDGPVTFILNY